MILYNFRLKKMFNCKKVSKIIKIIIRMKISKKKYLKNFNKKKNKKLKVN